MRAVAPLCPWAKKDRNACLWRQGPSCPAGRGKIAGPGPRNSERRAPAGERLSGRGETGWLARTQGGREPQRGSMPVRSTGEDSRPTEDNARRPVSPRPAPLWAELPANADASTVEVAYTGAMHAVVAAGMEDIEKGYSHMMHFVTPQSLQLREQLARVPATSRSQIVSGESVRIAITLHNASHYELDFHLATGETAPATAFARRPIIWACSSGCGARPIPPGSDFQDEIIVSKLFDLTVPGRYTLRRRRCASSHPARSASRPACAERASCSPDLDARFCGPGRRGDRNSRFARQSHDAGRGGPGGATFR